MIRKFFDVVIVGSGPAGLSAAIYTSRAGLSTMIIQGNTIGGLLTTTEKVDNYLGLPDTTGTDMAETFIKHSKKFGAETILDTVTKIQKNNDIFELSLQHNDNIFGKSVIYTAGSTPKKLNIIGEELNGVSYCATCDGGFYEDDPVVIVGGGESAVEDALYMANISSEVHVLVRGEEWKASEPAIKNLQDKHNVIIHMSTFIEEIIDDGHGNVNKIKTNNGIINVYGVFIAIGQQPNSQLAKDYTVLYDNGFVNKSIVDGFFVAGDIKDPDYRQVIIAAGDGAKAGIKATRYILDNQ